MRHHQLKGAVAVTELRAAGRLRLAPLAVAVLVGVGLVPALASAAVSSADEICAPTADPCVITQSYDVAPGSTLDFGVRAVEVSGSGELDFGSGPSTLRCGALDVTSNGTGTRIWVKDGGAGGRVTLEARRGCSGAPSISCTSDDECAAASAGTCSLGTGNLVLAGKIRGEGTPGGNVTLVAANDLTVSAKINLENGGSSPLNADGGSLTLTARAGSVTVNHTAASGVDIDLGGGGNAQGGTLDVEAGQDVTFAGDVEAKGGDDGGGDVDIVAGGNIVLSGDLLVKADQGEGVGGDVTLKADGNVTLAGASGANRAILDANGHKSGEEVGTGGSVELTAGGTITLGPWVLLSANGVDSGSEAGVIELTACDVHVLDDTTLQVTGEDGGRISISGHRAVEVQSGASVTATGSGGGSAGGIALVTGSLGVCENDPNIRCTVNSDCTVGCTTYQCLVNPDTGGTQSQFDPAPTIVESTSSASCG